MAGGADPARAARDLSESLARLRRSTAAYGRNKVESARDSVRREVRRRVVMVASACAMLILFLFGLLFAAVAVIIALRNHAPALAATGVAVFFFALSGVGAWIMVKAHRSGPGRVGWMAAALALFGPRRARREDS